MSSPVGTTSMSSPVHVSTTTMWAHWQSDSIQRLQDSFVANKKRKIAYTSYVPHPGAVTHVGKK